MSQKQIAAYHESGHAVMYAFHGVPMQYMTVNEDGTGFCCGSGGIINPAVHAEIHLGGLVAEEMHCKCLGRFVSSDAIHGVLEYYGGPSGVESDDGEPLDDLESAIVCANIVVSTGAHQNLVRLVLEANMHCQEVLKRNWSIVDALATAVLSAKDYTLYSAELERLGNGVH